MGYRKRGPKPKPLVVQVNTLTGPGAAHESFPRHCMLRELPPGPEAGGSFSGAPNSTPCHSTSPHPATLKQLPTLWGAPDAQDVLWGLTLYLLLPSLLCSPRYLPSPVAPMC